jgi:hypothetical protein
MRALAALYGNAQLPVKLVLASISTIYFHVEFP